MSTTSSPFDQIQETFRGSGTAAALERLAEQLIEDRKYHELFEARKLQVRHELGLPLLYAETGDELDEKTRSLLETRLEEICRDIGTALMEDGKFREGWMYLRPISAADVAREYLLRTEVTDENMDEIIELTLREGIAPAYGFELVLQSYGTCNSITTFDAELSQFPLEDRQQAAGQLVEHLHEELLENVKGDIASEENASPDETRFAELLPNRQWLFDGNRYHIDTTHLASVVRFARILEDEKQLRLAVDLTEYGKRLSSQYQYENEEPFADLYSSSQLFLNAVLGEGVDEALAFFEKKARDCDSYNEGYLPIEVFVDLLTRIGRHDEAIEALIDLMPDAAPKIGICPNILELSNRSGNFKRFTEFCRQQEDLLGFVTGLLHQDPPAKESSEA